MDRSDVLSCCIISAPESTILATRLSTWVCLFRRIGTFMKCNMIYRWYLIALIYDKHWCWNCLWLLTEQSYFLLSRLTTVWKRHLVDYFLKIIFPQIVQIWSLNWCVISLYLHTALPSCHPEPFEPFHCLSHEPLLGLRLAGQGETPGKCIRYKIIPKRCWLFPTFPI